MSDDGLRELANHPTLDRLGLGNNKLVTSDGISHLQSIPNLQELDLSGTALGDEIVEMLARFPQLRVVSLAGSKVTSEGAIRLQALLPKAAVVHIAVALEADKRSEQWVQSQGGTATMYYGRLVQTVTFRGGNIPATSIKNLDGLRGILGLDWSNLGNVDREAESIAKLESLQILELVNGSNFSDAGLSRLIALRQLQSLKLTDCKQITDTGFRQLAALDQLSILSLGGTAIGDNGLTVVGRLPNLREHLSLTNCKNITSEGLRHLSGFSELRRLNLTGTNVNDAAVVHLSKLTGLRALHLEHTNIRAAGVARLQQALPNCAIFYTGGAIVPGWTAYTPFAAPQAAGPARGKTPAKKAPPKGRGGKS